jgi:hypothetical protein
MKSTSFDDIGQYKLSINDLLPLASAFGTSPVGHRYNGSKYESGSFLGLDRIGLLNASGSAGPLNVNQSLIYDLADRSFWVGTLGIGLSALKINDNTTLGSLLGNISDSETIPSTTWGYTAGAYYSQFDHYHICRRMALTI